MAPNAEDLAKRLAALSERFTTLAQALAQATQQAQAGTMPSEDVVDEITKIRTDFVEVRHRIVEAARGLSITVPAIAEIDGVGVLGPMLEAVVQALAAQEKKAALSEARTRVMSVLDRVLMVTHSDGPNFAALVQCVIKAKEIRQAAQDPKAFDSEDAPAFLNSIPAFAALLSIIEGRAPPRSPKRARPRGRGARPCGRPPSCGGGRGQPPGRPRPPPARGGARPASAEGAAGPARGGCRDPRRRTSARGPGGTVSKHHVQRPRTNPVAPRARSAARRSTGARPRPAA